MAAQARVKKAVWMTGTRSQRILSRRKLCSQAKVRSTTQRQRPSRDPCSVWPRACLVSVRARSTGEGPVSAPTQGADLAGVDDRPRPVEVPDGVQAPQQLAVRALPHAG